MCRVVYPISEFRTILFKRNIMLIKLTNATPMHLGKDVIINADLITTIHRNEVKREETQIVDTVTFINIAPYGVWEVQETPDEVLAIIKAG